MATWTHLISVRGLHFRGSIQVCDSIVCLAIFIFFVSMKHYKIKSGIFKRVLQGLKRT